jgi:hypothetical protein
MILESISKNKKVESGQIIPHKFEMHPFHWMKSRAADDRLVVLEI